MGKGNRNCENRKIRKLVVQTNKVFGTGYYALVNDGSTESIVTAAFETDEMGRSLFTISDYVDSVKERWANNLQVEGIFFVDLGNGYDGEMAFEILDANPLWSRYATHILKKSTDEMPVFFFTSKQLNEVLDGFVFTRDSSVIKSAQYSIGEKKLRLTFTSGKVYEYADVDQNTFIELLKAESFGKFFNKNIRNNFNYELLAA